MTFVGEFAFESLYSLTLLSPVDESKGAVAISEDVKLLLVSGDSKLR